MKIIILSVILVVSLAQVAQSKMVLANISKIELDQHSDLQCSGTNVYIELLQDHNGEIKDKTECKTSHINNFSKGIILSWTGSELGSCATEEFDVLNDNIHFQVRSTSGDDFCPKVLTITTVDGYKYKSEKMEDWVDKSKGDHLRQAKRTSEITTTTIKTTTSTTTTTTTITTTQKATIKANPKTSSERNVAVQEEENISGTGLNEGPSKRIGGIGAP